MKLLTASVLFCFFLSPLIAEDHTAQKTAHPPEAAEKSDANRPLFSKTATETFRMKAGDGTKPEIQIFKDSCMGWSLNLAQGNLEDGRTVRMVFEGIVLTESATNPQEVEVRLVGRATETAIPGTVKKADLLAGKEIVVQIPVIAKELRVGQVRVSGKFAFALDPRTQGLKVHEASGKIYVAAKWLGTTSDEGCIKDAEAVRGPIERKPLRVIED